MNLARRIKNAWYMLAGHPVSLGDKQLLEWLGIDSASTPRRALSQTTYFICMKVLSESIGKLPLKLYQRTENGIQRPPMTDTLRLLSLQPNPYMTATIFWTLLEFCCQHYGNAFVWIDGELIRKGRYGGRYVIKGFYPMHPQNTTIVVDDAGLFGTAGNLYYQYVNPNTGEMSVFHDSEILHFKNWYTEDGIAGKPVRQILQDTIDGANSASDYENNLYKNGLTARLVMQYSSTLDEKLVAETQKIYADKLTGPKAAGKVIPIPENLRITPLNMSLVDAEFSTLRKYSARQIAASFGLKSGHLNDLEHSKYASSESDMLSFLTDTLAYRIKMYEDELNAKVLTPKEYKDGFYYKFNEKALLRVSNKEQSEILRNYVQGGIYTSDEARDYLDKPHIEGGDQLLVNGSYVPITEAGAAYKSKTGGNSK